MQTKAQRCGLRGNVQMLEMWSAALNTTHKTGEEPKISPRQKNSWVVFGTGSTPNA